MDDGLHESVRRLCGSSSTVGQKSGRFGLVATVPAEPWMLAMFAMHKSQRVAAATGRQTNCRDCAGHGLMRDHAAVTYDRAQE